MNESVGPELRAEPRRDPPEHTPTPWKYDGICYIWGPNSEMIVDEGSPDPDELATIRMRGVGAQLPIKQNAEFIVRACNAHDDLLAANETAVIMLGMFMALSGREYRNNPNQLLSALDNILGMGQKAITLSTDARVKAEALSHD